MIKTLLQNLRAKAGTAFSRSNHAHKLQDILFFAILFVLPFQFGKHFWPSFAYVAGQRVDYLSPTLHVSDILILLLFIVTMVLSFLRKQESRFWTSQNDNKPGFRVKTGMTSKKVLLLLGTILFLSFGIFFSQSPMNGWYSLVKLLELAFFAWFVAQHGKIVFPKLLYAFGFGVMIEGLLGILQFFHQGSLNGLWYFLGERTFTAATPGIANASIYGQLVLRSYATFPHPNVFAGYLVVALLFFLVWGFTVNEKKQRILSACLLIFGTGVLFLTLSRVAILVFSLLSVVFLVVRFSKKKKWLVLLVGIFGIGIFCLDPLLGGRFLDIRGYDESLYLRTALFSSACQMFITHPFFGVGLGNFLPALPQFISAKILFGFLQPVHNMYMLVLAETGMVGLVGFLLVLGVAFAESFKKVKANRLFQFPFLALCAICLIGLTDHYFLTLQQGQLLFALVLGLCFV